VVGRAGFAPATNVLKQRQAAGIEQKILPWSPLSFRYFLGADVSSSSSDTYCLCPDLCC
jgi:hypothetical protein